MTNLESTPPVESNVKTTFSKRQVYMMLKEFVYPPCAKHPENIRIHHMLESDLGYEGNSRQLLAGKTNGVFSLQEPHKFNGQEMMNLDSVRDHHNETIKKLRNLGRIQKRG